MDTTTCPECGALAEVRERDVLDSTDGSVERARTFCARGHSFMVPVAALAHPPRECGVEIHVPAGRADMVERLTPGEGGPMRILLLCSAFNGPSQRAWLELRTAGHHVVVALSGDDDAVRAAVAAAAATPS